MSTVKAKNVQVGTDTTAANNVVWAVPATQDGSVRLQRGNAGVTTSDIIGILPNDYVTIPKLDTPMLQASFQAIAAGTWAGQLLNITNVTGQAKITVSGTRATPQQAGWYFIDAKILLGSSASNYFRIHVNGTLVKHAYCTGGTPNPIDMDVSSLAYFNGTTDYAEFQVQNTFQQTWGDGPHASLSMFFVRG